MAKDDWDKSEVEDVVDGEVEDEVDDNDERRVSVPPLSGGSSMGKRVVQALLDANKMGSRSFRVTPWLVG